MKKNTWTLKQIPLNQLSVGKNHREAHQDEDLSSLMGSIKENGLQSPIKAIKGKDGKLRIIWGRRRFEAMKKLRMDSIPCFIETKNLSEFEINILSLLENLQRNNPSPIEYGLTFEKMVKDGGYTSKEIALFLSKPESYINSCLYAASKIPKVYRSKIVIQEGSSNRKKGTINISSAKLIENARRAEIINQKECKVLYSKAENGTPIQEISNVVSSVKKGVKFKEAVKTNGKGKILQVSFSMAFFKSEVGPDMALFKEKMKNRIYKELKFSRP